MCQDDVAELPSWTEGARRMHGVGSEMDADSQVCPSQRVRGKRESQPTKYTGCKCKVGLGNVWH